MNNKKHPFNLAQLFAGFCPPSSVDRFEIVGDSDNESNHGIMNVKGVPSVMVVDSPLRRPEVIEKSLEASVPDDTTPVKDNKGEIHDLSEDIPTRNNETSLVTTDSTACELTDEPPSIREEDNTAQSNSNRKMLQSMAMTSALLVSILVIFHRSTIECMSYDAILSLVDKGSINVNAYIDPFLANVVSKSVPKAESESFVESRETPQVSRDPSKDTKEDDVSTDCASESSILSQEHDELPEGQHPDVGVDETEGNESVGSRSKQDDIGEEDPAPKYPKPEQKDKRIQFFKLETDETGTYLVSCEKSFAHDTVDTPPTIVCSKTK